MFFRTTGSLRSFLRSYVAPDAPSWLTAFLLYSLWFPWNTMVSSPRAMGHSYEGEVSKLPALPLVSLSDHLSCCRKCFHLLVESVYLTSAFNPHLAEQHCKLSSFLHFSSAMRCMEYCHLVIVAPLMILTGCGLWQLLRGFNSLGSCVSEDLSLWHWNNSCSSLSCWNFCMALWFITVIINKVKNVQGEKLRMHLARKNWND